MTNVLNAEEKAEAPAFFALDSYKPFRGHIISHQNPVWRTLIELNEN